MKNGDKLQVKLRGGEVVDALYIRQEETAHGPDGQKIEIHVLVACEPLPKGYADSPMDKTLVGLVGREPTARWECAFVDGGAV